jgi:purine-nucleoside/S-methyl-5'-thioadenosine phosphorylase / adenosine deaminase
VELPPPFYGSREHVAIDFSHARALFTTRRGGVSCGPFESLNLGRLTDDDPDAVIRNRDLLQARIGGRMAMVRQVHGARVLTRDDPERASGSTPPGELEEADGQVTARRGIAPIVLTADCLPVAVAGGGAVAMLHAGWRGLAEGVLEAGVREMRAVSNGDGLAAAIGPGAGRCCYEVGEEVHERFVSYGDTARNGTKLDLKAIAREQLRRAGVAEIHDVGLCTMCAPSWLFFSHRRDRGVTGRQAGVAWLT